MICIGCGQPAVSCFRHDGVFWKALCVDCKSGLMVSGVRPAGGRPLDDFPEWPAASNRDAVNMFLSKCILVVKKKVGALDYASDVKVYSDDVVKIVWDGLSVDVSRPMDETVVAADLSPDGFRVTAWHEECEDVAHHVALLAAS